MTCALHAVYVFNATADYFPWALAVFGDEIVGRKERIYALCILYTSESAKYLIFCRS